MSSSVTVNIREMLLHGNPEFMSEESVLHWAQTLMHLLLLWLICFSSAFCDFLSLSFWVCFIIPYPFFLPKRLSAPAYPHCLLFCFLLQAFSPYLSIFSSSYQWCYELCLQHYNMAIQITKEFKQQLCTENSFSFLLFFFSSIQIYLTSS